jgi:hypothetical protein
VTPPPIRARTGEIVVTGVLAAVCGVAGAAWALWRALFG